MERVVLTGQLLYLTQLRNVAYVKFKVQRDQVEELRFDSPHALKDWDHLVYPGMEGREFGATAGLRLHGRYRVTGHWVDKPEKYRKGYGFTRQLVVEDVEFLNMDAWDFVPAETMAVWGKIEQQWKPDPPLGS